MKPKERKQFFQDHRLTLTRSQMADRLGISEATIERHYEPKFGKCLDYDPKDKEALSRFLMKAKTERELDKHFPNWRKTLDGFEGMELFTQRNLYHELVYVLLPVRNDKIEIQDKDWHYHVGVSDEGIQQPYLLVQLPDFEGKTVIAPIYDIHSGHHAHRSEKFRAYLRWIAETPQVYAILGGDMMEMALDDGRGMSYDQELNPETQFDQAVKLLAPIAHKILGAVPGNHEERVYKRTGIDIMRLFCERLEIPYFSGPFFLSIMANGYKWTYHVQHGRGNSQTKGGKMNAANRPKKFTGMIHFFLSGHVHDLVVEPETIIVEDPLNCRLVYMTQWTVIAPSFLGWEDTYAYRAGYPPPAMGGVSTELMEDGDYRAFLT